MDFFSIIIDRVGSTNIFNIVQGRMPSKDTHLQSIVDDDLIQEFLVEIERLSRISNSISDTNYNSGLDIAAQLRSIGDTFFMQFFPEQIQERLRGVERGVLFLHVDHRLRNIPWELLHDGGCFLADKFYMGKNISGYWQETTRPERNRLRVLIIADPTEDLEWARREGEALFESLNAELSADRLDVQLLTGRRITKLNLLNAIKDRDIIHYTGHLFHSGDQKESGWLLSGDKVLRAREIEKAGFAPDLVFSNSCFSSAITTGAAAKSETEPLVEQDARFNDLAGAFLRAGICNYIGTNWEIRDNSRTYDFAMNFYRAIFEEKSVGEALFQSRLHARRSYPPQDLTWANYVLHGNPLARIYRSANRRTFDASRNVRNANRVVDTYPIAIALEYRRFTEAVDMGKVKDSMQLLVAAFERTLQVVGAVVFGNYSYLSMKKKLPNRSGAVSLEVWMELVYECVTDIRSLQMDLSATGLLESLYLHRVSFFKLLHWRKLYRNNEQADEDYDSYLVTFQYLFDNLLSDFVSLGRYQILYLKPDGENAILLHGQAPRSIRLVPVEFKAPALREMAQDNKGHVCFYNSSRKVLFSLQNFMGYDLQGGCLYFPNLDEKGLEQMLLH